MCGIAGFTNFHYNYNTEYERWNSILENMNNVQKHRGPDDEGIYLDKNCGLAHVRLSIIDIEKGHQPMTRYNSRGSCTIVYNGEIYNMHELRSKLKSENIDFKTTSDTEVILLGYMKFGIDFIKELNGIFSFAIWDFADKKLLLVRDRVGVKPLFYTKIDDTLVFSSEIKGLFEYPNFKPILNRESLCEIFALGPAKTEGKGVFKDVYEVPPGCWIEYTKDGINTNKYWELISKVHEDSFEETVEKTSFLIYDSVKKQMLSDIPISTFLSGGVDSSLVTSICASELQKEGKILNTFSFDFKNNKMYFKSNTFQPSQDRPWVDKMVEYSKTNHRYLECDNIELIDYLFKAVDARDLPCMTDVESSLLYFCSKVVNFNKVTLTGECADEIFGGYPWFHKKELFEKHGFPWSYDMEPRKALLKDDLIDVLNLEEYSINAYEKSIKEVPLIDSESEFEQKRRKISYLNLKWFMVTLLDRMDRTSMFSGLEARVPLADHRIVEYLWNVPWEMKYHNKIVKGLLRAAGEKYLPNEVLYRKKSPYPKTYNPEYEKLLGNMLIEIITQPNSPIRKLIDYKKVKKFLNSPSDYGKPWYGQLMAGPQMLAFILQINYWLEKYKITIEL